MIKRILAAINSHREIGNSLWVIGEQVFQMLITLIVGMISARYLGPDNLGILNYTVSFVTFFTAIASLGMEGVVIKKMINAPDDEGVYLGSCMVYRLVSSAISICLVVLVVYILNPTEPIKVLLVLLQSMQLMFRAFQILDSWFQRHLKSKYVSIGKMAACIVVSAYKILLLVYSKGIVWFAFSYCLTDLVIALVLFVFYKRQHSQRLGFSNKVGKEVLRESYHFILSGIMVAIYSRMDTVMIGEMMSNSDVGYYTTALRICGLWTFVPLAIINSFRPSIMEVKRSGDEHRYIRRLEQLYSGIIWLSIAAALFITVLAPVIVYILYGKAFLGAVPALRIAVWYEIFSMIGTARGIWILCEDKNRYVKYCLGGGAIVNLILNALLIPRFGIEGAAFATLVTQIVTSIVMPMLFRETRIHTRYVIEAFALKWYFKKDV